MRGRGTVSSTLFHACHHMPPHYIEPAAIIAEWYLFTHFAHWIESVVAAAPTGVFLNADSRMLNLNGPGRSQRPLFAIARHSRCRSRSR